MEVKITTGSLHQSRCRASGNKNFFDGYPKRPFTGSFFISFGTEINWLPVLILAVGETQK
jgi:hypothetical protein